MTDVDIDHLRTWIGCKLERVDTITPRLASNFNAIFDADLDLHEGQIAPVAIHWCLAPDIAPMSALGKDGHPARGGFLPPVPFPRRMWAGGTLNYHGTFVIGDVVTKSSRIADVMMKTGRTGSLIFVTVLHDYRTKNGLILSERQDIVYREREAKPPAAEPSANSLPLPDRQVLIEASETLLFRYSAVTFNGHRIHYDLDYVTKDEGYPGLVFHGPLQASYLLRLACREFHGAFPREFAFRSVKPLFSGGIVTSNAYHGDERCFWFANQSGEITMNASATEQI